MAELKEFDPPEDRTFSCLAFRGVPKADAVDILTDAMKDVVPEEHRHNVKFDVEPTIHEVGLVRSCRFTGQAAM